MVRVLGVRIWGKGGTAEMGFVDGGFITRSWMGGEAREVAYRYSRSREERSWALRWLAKEYWS